MICCSSEVKPVIRTAADIAVSEVAKARQTVETKMDILKSYMKIPIQMTEDEEEVVAPIRGRRGRKRGREEEEVVQAPSQFVPVAEDDNIDSMTADTAAYLKNVPLLPYDELKSHIMAPVRICNHMCTMRMNITDASGASITLDLDALRRVMPKAFASSSRTPSMIIFDEESLCVAILTKRGNLNMVGGFNVTQIGAVLERISKKIQDGMHLLSPDIVVKAEKVILKNIAASHKIPGFKLDTHNLADYMKSRQLSFRYFPESRDLLVFKPLPLTRESIYARIFPSGGIFFFGLHTMSEVKMIFGVLFSVLFNFMRGKRLTGSELRAWREKRKKTREKAKHDKYQKRDKKMTGWEEEMIKIDREEAHSLITSSADQGGEEEDAECSEDDEDSDGVD